MGSVKKKSVKDIVSEKNERRWLWIYYKGVEMEKIEMGEGYKVDLKID